MRTASATANARPPPLAPEGQRQKSPYGQHKAPLQRRRQRDRVERRTTSRFAFLRAYQRAARSGGSFAPPFSNEAEAQLLAAVRE